MGGTKISLYLTTKVKKETKCRRLLESTCRYVYFLWSVAMVENLNILKIFEKSSNLQIKEYLRFVPHFYSGWGMGAGCKLIWVLLVKYCYFGIFCISLHIICAG